MSRSTRSTKSTLPRTHEPTQTAASQSEPAPTKGKKLQDTASNAPTSNYNTECACGQAFSDDTVQECIQCDDCSIWWHTKCTGLSAATFKSLTSLKTAKYTCPYCAISQIDAPRIKDHLKTIISSSTEKTDTADAPPTTVEPETKAETSTKLQDTAHKPIPKATEEGDTDSETSFVDYETPSEGDPEPATTYRNPDLIVILDGLIPGKYRNSAAAKKEINKWKPGISFSEVYSLHLGGIAIVCKDENSKDLALEPWSQEAFDSASVNAHPPTSASSNKTYKLIAKNVHKSVTEEDLAEQIKHTSNSSVCTVRRLFNRKTIQYLPVAEITVDSPQAKKRLLEKGLPKTEGKPQVIFEPKRRQKIVRCFNCQGFGHPAHQCTKDAICIKCGDSVDHSAHTCLTTKCANCKEAHSADSKHCEHYKKVVKLTIEKQHAYMLTEH